VVEAVHGAHVFADTNAHGQGEQPQFLYTVRFQASALWPEEAGLTHSVSIDAFEPYLEAA
jgi:nitrile hydratase